MAQGVAPSNLSENALLASAARDLVACVDEDAVFALLSDFSSKLTPEAIVVVNRLGEDGESLVTYSVEGLPRGGLETITRLMGLDVVGHAWPVSGSLNRGYFAPALTRLDGGFCQYMGELIPKPVAKMVEKAFDVRDVYTIGIVQDKAVYGNVSFITHGRDVRVPTDVIEAFIYPCFVTLDRMRANRMLAETVESYRVLTETIRDVVWTLDADDMRYTYISPSVLQLRGYAAEEILGRELGTGMSPADALRARTTIREHVVAIEQGNEPEGASFIMELELSRKAGTPVPMEVVGSIYRNEKSGRLEVRGVSRDISERLKASADLERANERLEDALRSVTESMGRVVEVRDPYTQGHQQGVARISKLIAIEMGLPKSEVDGIEVAALVHDLGKLSVPIEILAKPGALSPLEFELVKGHSQAGHDILMDVDFGWPIAEIVLQHHERMDGSGYPRGLAGDEILVPSRVLMAADVIEAMGSHRPYRAALGLEAAIEELKTHAEKFDADVLAAAQALFERGEILL